MSNGYHIATIYQVWASNANTADGSAGGRGPCFPLHADTDPVLCFLSCFLCHACCVANGISGSKLTFFHTLCPFEAWTHNMVLLLLLYLLACFPFFLPFYIIWKIEICRFVSSVLGCFRPKVETYVAMNSHTISGKSWVNNYHYLTLGKSEIS